MYILSIDHTHKSEKFMTLWRPNNQGYCYSKENAGFYLEPKEGYHDNEGNMPITELLANELFKILPYEGVLKEMIPNNKESWDKLGLKISKKGLKRITKN